MTAVFDALMDRLYGENLWTGFTPRGPADAVQGWNGRHPSLKRLPEGAADVVVIDVGVWKGQSTITMAAAMRDQGLNGCVIAVDTFLGSPEHWGKHGELFARAHGRPDIYETFLSNVAHAGLTGYVIPLPQTSVNAARILARRRVRADIVHVDAAHEYEEVLRDATDYWALLKPGGVLIGDDYAPSWPGVIQAAADFSTQVGRPVTIEKPKWIVHKAE
jgi:predicted O-methyltransferase YrrM